MEVPIVRLVDSRIGDKLSDEEDERDGNVNGAIVFGRLLLQCRLRQYKVAAASRSCRSPQNKISPSLASSSLLLVLYSQICMIRIMLSCVTL